MLPEFGGNGLRCPAHAHSYIPPLEAHLDGVLGAHLNTLHAAGALFKANTSQDEILGGHLLKFSRRHTGTKPQSMHGAN